MLWLAGLVWFVATEPDLPLLPADGRVDAVVVLTGSAGRIAAGLEVLKSGRARRMLVSGVDPELPLSALRPAIPADEDLFRCCIDLGRAARNTEGNAAEAVAWARAHGHRSLAVVTADWHMRRSLLEFARHPDAPRLYAIPVAGDAGLARLFLEYNKYLVAALRRLAAAPSAVTYRE
ncbi:MAG: YdcF family protein [Rhodothalassiaceae bacterium]